MLYQIHENGVKHVVRFGSKGLSKWQQSYGPTKLELLGVVTSVLDCASFLRGRHFVIECDHQALKPLFQKQLKGAIYERWLAILQQFDCDIQWKSASEMVVPDSLSRAIQYPEVLTNSPEEDDTFFPYVADNPTRVCLHNSSEKADVQDLPLCVNKMERLQHQSPLYDGDTEDNVLNDLPRSFRRKGKLNRSKNSHKLKNHDYLCSSPHQHSFDQVSSESSLIDQIDCKTKANIDSNSQTEGTLLMPHPCIGTDTQPSSQMEDAPTNNKSIGDSNSPVPVDLHVTLPEELSTSAVPHSHSSMTDTAMDSASNSDPQLKCYEVLTKLNMTPESIYNCQKTDPDLQPILDYFEKGQLPKQQKLARRVLLQHSDFTVLDGMLFHNRLARSVRTKSQRQYQLVIPKSMIKFVLELCHDSPLAGHGGIQDTVERIREHFFFTNLVSIVGDYVRSCHQCQSRKLTTAHFKNRITSYPTPKEPFSVWEIDLYGPLPTSQRANTYLFTAVDMFSKFLFARPLPNKDAISVSEILFEIFSTYGVCDTLISDQGSEFIAKVTTHLCSLLGISQQFTPSFVHHCLGSYERIHRTLAEKLTPYLTSQCNTWDSIVSAIVFSINNAVNSSTKYSPFEIVYSMRPKFPLCLIPKDLLSIPKDYTAYLVAKQSQLDIIRQNVKINAINYS